MQVACTSHHYIEVCCIRNSETLACGVEWEVEAELMAGNDIYIYILVASSAA